MWVMDSGALFAHGAGKRWVFGVGMGEKNFIFFWRGLRAACGGIMPLLDTRSLRCIAISPPRRPS
jgi:hypothetical protein